MESNHYRILASVRPQPPRKKHFKIQQIHKVPVWLRANIGTGVSPSDVFSLGSEEKVKFEITF